MHDEKKHALAACGTHLPIPAELCYMARDVNREERMEPTERVRCGWCLGHPTYVAYHDQEWGVPIHDDRRLFEFLILEGAQAGLSWLTILKRREGYRVVYADFDPEQVARFDAARVEALLGDARIIRNRRKVEGSIRNAQAFLRVQAEFGSFDRFIWDFVEGRPVVNHHRSLAELPATSPLSDRVSRELIRRGFSFVGSTIVYAHLQATGMVNDHLTECYRWAEVCALHAPPLPAVASAPEPPAPPRRTRKRGS